MTEENSKLEDERRRQIEAATEMYNVGRAADAAKELLDCLSLFDEDERETREYAVLCCNLGSALAESGELKTAVQFFHTSLAIHNKREEEQDAALIHFNLGNVYKYANNWQGSVNHYRKALDAFHRLGDKGREAICLTALGHFFAQLGVVDKIRSYLSRIWPLRWTLTTEGRWSFYTLLSHFAGLTDRKRKALSLANKALTLAEHTGNEAYVRTTHYIRAHLLSELGEGTVGLEELEQAHAHGRSDREWLERSFSLALSHADKGNLSRALVMLRECVDEIHRRRLQLDGSERYLFMERYAEIGRKYVELLSKQDDWRSAFEASEEVQARSVLDLMFRHQIKRQEGRLITSGPNGRLYLNTSRCAEVAEFLGHHTCYMLKFFFPREDLLLAWLMTPYGSVFGWDASAGIPHLNMVHNKLPLSHYLQSAVHVKIEEGKAEVSPTPITEQCDGSSPDWDGIVLNLSRFYEDAICEAARSELEKNKGNLVIVPHMNLDAIPFSLMGPRSGPQIGANWAITTAPSASTCLQLDRRRDVSPCAKGKSELQVLLVGDCGPQRIAIPLLPQSEDRLSLLEFCDLPGTRIEIAHLLSILGGIALTRTEATKEKILGHFQESDIIHFATHGLWDPMFSYRSFLLLNGEVLSAMEVEQLVTHSGLVFLSACQTGLGQPRPDSRIGLAESFLIAGARSVLVSLWPISDLATTTFVELFYSRVLKGFSPAQALQATQSDMAAEPTLSHMSHWAGFQLCGWAFYPLVDGQVATPFRGPVFCGGDVLWQAEAGKAFPLKQFKEYVQAPHKGAFIVEDRIYDLPKSGTANAP